MSKSFSSASIHGEADITSLAETRHRQIHYRKAAENGRLQWVRGWFLHSQTSIIVCTGDPAVFSIGRIVNECLLWLLVKIFQIGFQKEYQLIHKGYQYPWYRKIDNTPENSSGQTHCLRWKYIAGRVSGLVQKYQLPVFIPWEDYSYAITSHHAICR